MQTPQVKGLVPQNCSPLQTPKESLGLRTSLVVQWLRLHTSTAGCTGSIPGRGSKIPHTARCDQKKEKKRESLGLGYFWQTGCKSGHPTMPCSGSNLLEQITELRRTLYLHLLVYYKGYNSGTVKWKRYVGQGMGCGEGTQSFHSPSGCVTLPAPRWLHQPGNSQNPVVSVFYGDFIT